MNRHTFKSLAIAGLALAAISPAYADHQNAGFDVRIGRATLQYYVYDRPYDRRYDWRYDRRYDWRYDRRYDWRYERRYERDYRHWLKKQQKHNKQHKRLDYAHDNWHWYNDGRWDPYYHYDHEDVHRDLRHLHRDKHRAKRRH